jgi:hypothetical protein
MGFSLTIQWQSAQDCLDLVHPVFITETNGMKVNRNINDTPIIRNGTEFLMCEQNLKI